MHELRARLKTATPIVACLCKSNHCRMLQRRADVEFGPCFFGVGRRLRPRGISANLSTRVGSTYITTRVMQRVVVFAAKVSKSDDGTSMHPLSSLRGTSMLCHPWCLSTWLVSSYHARHRRYGADGVATARYYSAHPASRR